MAEKKISWIRKHPIRSIVIAIFLIGLIGNMISPASNTSTTTSTPTTTTTETAAKPTTSAVGDEGTLNYNDSLTNCEGSMILGNTKEDYDAAMKALQAKDNYGLAELIQQGRAFGAENCAKAKVIDASFAMRKVRLSDNPSIAGWIPYEWFHKN